MCTFLRFRLHHVLIRLVFPIRVVAFFFLFILHDVPSIFILCLQDLIGNSGRRDKFLAFNKLFNPLQRKRNTKREGKQNESCQENHHRIFTNGPVFQYLTYPQMCPSFFVWYSFALHACKFCHQSSRHVDQRQSGFDFRRRYRLDLLVVHFALCQGTAHVA